MFNGGKKLYKELGKKPDWLVEFKNEIKKIHEELAKEKEFKQHKKKREKRDLTFNHEGSYMNIKLCQIENNILLTILMCIYNELGTPETAVLCFDGLMVELGVETDLPKLQEAVAEHLGINIQLVEKPLDQGFELPEDLPQHADYAMPNLTPLISAINTTTSSFKMSSKKLTTVLMRNYTKPCTRDTLRSLTKF